MRAKRILALLLALLMVLPMGAVQAGEPQVDKAALQAAIAEATTFLSASEEGYAIGKYPKGSKNALQAVIDAARLVEQDADASETAIVEAFNNVNTALATFEASVITVNPASRQIYLEVRNWRTAEVLTEVTMKVNGITYTIGSTGYVLATVFEGNNDIEVSKAGYLTSVLNDYEIDSGWESMWIALNKIRTVKMIVKDSETNQAINGVTMVVNQNSYTTDEMGAAIVTTGEVFNEITLSKPGYELRTLEEYHLIVFDEEGNDTGEDQDEYIFELDALNRTALIEKIQEAIATLGQAVEGNSIGQYPEEAMTEFEAAIAAAENVNDTAITQVAVNDALQALIGALAAFEGKQIQAGDNADLQEVVTGAKSLLDDISVGIGVGQYPEAAVAALQAAIEAAEAVTGREASPAEIDAALQALAAAVEEFEDEEIHEGDSSLLETKITEITAFLNASQEGNRAGQYPAGSKSILQAAVTAAQSAIDSPASQVQIDNAYTLLMTAYDTFRGSVRTISPRNDDDTPAVAQPQPVVQPPTKITDGMNTVETGQGTVKTTANEVQKIMEAAKPVILESTIATIDFGKKGLNVVELKEGLNASLELGAKVTEKAKTDEVLSSAKLDSAGLTPLGGKVLDLIAQMNYSDGTSKKIKSFAEPVKVTINLKELGLTGDTTNLTAVRFVPQEDGTYKTVKLGGVYNPATNSFEFYTDSFSLYSIVKADDITKITFTIDSKAYSIGQLAKQTDVPPVVQEQRTLVPIRVVAETLGAKVDWNNDTQTVTITLDGKVLTMTLGQLIEGMDVPAQAMNGRTLVPLRYVSEKLGAYVMWFGEAQRIEIIK